MRQADRLMRRLLVKVAEELGVPEDELESTVDIAMQAAVGLGKSRKRRKSKSAPDPKHEDDARRVAAALPRTLPRRGDEDLREATDAPVFLIQRRRLVVTDMSGLDWDSDIEKFVEQAPLPRELTDAQMVKADRAHWEWDTHLVAFTRKEAEDYAKAKSYNGPFRVYAVPAMGELRTILRSLTDYQLTKNITFCGQAAVLVCDGRCDKAWGLSQRPREQLDPDNEEDFAWLADNELGTAPDDPGTEAGFQGKPSPDKKLESKWCARECERSQLFRPGEPIALRDFSQRFYNIRPHQRPGKASP